MKFISPTVQFHYFAKHAFISNKWHDTVLLTVDVAGWIVDIQFDQVHDDAIILDGFVLPGMLNLHSHAFQRAMAGLTERATGQPDSFWTWREIMYQFLEKLTPEDQQAIAAQLYVEMLKAGFTTVGEFHYLHHQVNGKPYHDRALSSHHIITAAKEAGIAITHMPVLYAYNGFGGQAPTDSQKRFLNDEDQLLNIISILLDHYKQDPQITIGLAHHSLRAVTPAMLQQTTAAMLQINPNAPIHIHIAEQIKEVNDCLAWSGKRPVEWLFDHLPINQQWCLVHATHMTAMETHQLAQSGAVAGLCPTTEANLGDGLFNFTQYMQADGRFGIGSDSHISVSMMEELRLLEYGQRLQLNKRAVASSELQPSVGTFLYTKSLSGGAQALGRMSGAIEIGKRADFISLDAHTPALLCKRDEQILDAMIFAGNVNPIRHVVVGGQHIIKDFHHRDEDEIFSRYRKTLEKLLGMKQEYKM